MIEWARRGAIKVAVLVDDDVLEPVADQPRPPSLTSADVAQMVACPVCLATVAQTCRTASGNSTEHAERLIPRRCSCGALLQPKKTYCEPCRADARRRTYWLREVATPTATRRAGVA